MARMNPSFTYEYDWLSNFYQLESPIVYQNISYYTVENFYCAMKTHDQKIRKEISYMVSSLAKSTGRSIELRSDWEETKLKIMLTALRYKFSTANPILRAKLIATKDSYIQESNWWGDEFFGVCMKTGIGKNMLGRMLMKVRAEIKENED